MMADYTKLTELDINRQVAIARGEYKEAGEIEFIEVVGDTWHAVDKQTRVMRNMFVDYCNNPADWAPLLEELQRLGQVTIEGCTIQFEDTISENPELYFFIGRTKSLGKRVCILWLMVKGG